MIKKLNNSKTELLQTNKEPSQDHKTTNTLNNTRKEKKKLIIITIKANGNSFDKDTSIT